jgi:hypothetical protein
MHIGSKAKGFLTNGDIDLLSPQQFGSVKIMMSAKTPNHHFVMNNEVAVIITGRWAIIPTFQCNAVVMDRSTSSVVYMPHGELSQAQQFEATNILLNALMDMKSLPAVAVVQPADTNPPPFVPSTPPPVHVSGSKTMVLGVAIAVAMAAVCFSVMHFQTEWSNHMSNSLEATTQSMTKSSDAMSIILERLMANTNRIDGLNTNTIDNTNQIDGLNTNMAAVRDELARINAENKRIVSENKRISAENKRRTDAENKRIVSENKRVELLYDPKANRRVDAGNKCNEPRRITSGNIEPQQLSVRIVTPPSRYTTHDKPSVPTYTATPYQIDTWKVITALGSFLTVAAFISKCWPLL